MGKRVTVSFQESDEDLFDWMEEQSEHEDHRNRSHVIVKALELYREEREAGETFT